MAQPNDLCQVGPTASILFLLKSTFHLLAWLDGVEEKNKASGFMDGNWPPVQKEIHRAVCKVSLTLNDASYIEGRIPLG